MNRLFPPTSNSTRTGIPSSSDEDWREFFYTDYWVDDEPGNRTYQPKRSPKWISDDGRKMVLLRLKDERISWYWARCIRSSCSRPMGTGGSRSSVGQRGGYLETMGNSDSPNTRCWMPTWAPTRAVPAGSRGTPILSSYPRTGRRTRPMLVVEQITSSTS